MVDVYLTYQAQVTFASIQVLSAYGELFVPFFLFSWFRNLMRGAVPVLVATRRPACFVVSVEPV
jgi:hypothetical protein